MRRRHYGSSINRTRYSLENVAPVAPDTWSSAGGAVHLRVGASQDPNELSVVAPAVSALLILQSVSRVSIRGLRFAASGNGGATTNHHLFKEVAAIQVLSGSGVSLEGCEVSQSDANGLFISGGTDIALRSLYIHTVVGGGVHAAGVNGLLLEDSVLRGSALSINRGVNVTVARCEVSHTDNSAIEIFGVPTAMPISDCGATAPTYTVRDSHVHTVGLGRVSDFGGTLQTATSMKLLMPSEPDSNCGVGAGWCFFVRDLSSTRGFAVLCKQPHLCDAQLDYE